MRLLRTSTPDSRPVWIGSPQQMVRAGIIVTQAVPMFAGQVAWYSAECQGTIKNYPDGSLLPFVMFQTASVVVFPPGVTPPDLYTFGVWPPQGGQMVSGPIGMDIGLSVPNYYQMVSRSGAYQATVDGTHTFVLYMWAGSDVGGVGNAAMVAPGAMMTVTAP